MSRQKSPDSQNVTMSVKFTEAQAAAVDEARGTLTRGEWLRRLVLAALEAAPAARPPGRRRKPEPAVGRCTHPGTRVIGGYCPECDRLTGPGGVWK